jgi:serine/threonine protein kinase
MIRLAWQLVPQLRSVLILTECTAPACAFGGRVRQIPQGTVVHDSVHGVAYRIKCQLGKGGFGVTYRAVRLNGRGGEERGSDTCLKFTTHDDQWYGEVYFGNLLKQVGHVVRMKSAFTTPLVHGRSTHTAFVIDMELVENGSVTERLQRTGSDGWSEAQVAFRVRQLLKPLSLLHNMAVSHRDVTPRNVFVGNHSVLKLGDFGITRAQLHPSGVEADIFAPAFAPRDVGRWWSPADDVYQVGLLMATLLAGEEVCCDVKKPAINRLTSKGPLRDAIKAAISVKARRPRNAEELSALLPR